MTAATRIVVSGYASLDHSMAVAALPGADRTAVVQRRLRRGWPSPGGSPRFIALALREQGWDVDVLSWLGADDAGQRYLAELGAAGVGTDGVAVRPGAHSPHSFLFHAPEGTACFFDPAVPDPGGLAPAQRRLARAADWVAISVGYPTATRELLDHAAAGTRFAWAVKADPQASPPELVTRLLARSHFVGFNVGERTFLEEATARRDPLALLPADAVAVETGGADGCTVHHRDGREHLEIDAAACGDTTGAGDTLFGAALGRLVEDWPPVEAARAGMAAASRLLAERADEIAEEDG